MTQSEALEIAGKPRLRFVPTWTTRKKFDWFSCPACAKYHLEWSGSNAVCACGYQCKRADLIDTRMRMQRGYPTTVLVRA